MQSKKRIVVVVVSIIVICVIARIIYAFNGPLYKMEHTNHAWGYQNHGYVIYKNGTIKEFDKSRDKNPEEKLQKAQISKEELQELKSLASQVKDEYSNVSAIKEMWGNQIIEIPPACDAGVTIKKIYSNRFMKWVYLSKNGDALGENTDPVAEDILELTNKLYEKYLKD